MGFLKKKKKEKETVEMQSEVYEGTCSSVRMCALGRPPQHRFRGEGCI